MKKEELAEILEGVKSGRISTDDAVKKISFRPYEDLGFAKVDFQREIIQGEGEVIYGAGKTPEQIGKIIETMLANGQKHILVTRMSPEAAGAVPEDIGFEYDSLSRTGVVGGFPEPETEGYIAVVTAGTSDLPIAEEAAKTAEIYGSRVERLYDVGVSGLHRLISKMDVLSDADVVVSIAGMEGALTSVVGGLVSCPVIGVPTSVGYGASFNGLSALLSMLNSCAPGVSVVNIDNGFGAGYLASVILHRTSAKRGSRETPEK